MSHTVCHVSSQISFWVRNQYILGEISNRAYLLVRILSLEVQAALGSQYTPLCDLEVLVRLSLLQAILTKALECASVQSQ